MAISYLDRTVRIKGADISPFANALQALPERKRRGERHNLLMQKGEMNLENMSRDQQLKILETAGKVHTWAGNDPAKIAQGKSASICQVGEAAFCRWQT